MDFESSIEEFISLSNTYNVKHILVGGAAVNYYGFNRHSQDIDFWIKTDEENLLNLKSVLKDMGYLFDQFPIQVAKKEMNISVKISSVMELELITSISLDADFDTAYELAEISKTPNRGENFRIINYQHLIANKKRTARTKDQLDIIELEKINKNKS